MRFYRPYADRQYLTLREVIVRDIVALYWLQLEEKRFLAWLRCRNRWFVFTRVEVYLDGWANYSWPTPRWGYQVWQFITMSAGDKA